MLMQSPAVGLVGPRQVGKSTLAKEVNASRDAVLLDLQLPQSKAALTDPTLFFRENAHRLVIIDEVQREPRLFGQLRPLIDEDRRPGRFLLLGSASPALMREANESLAGRVFYHELTPLSLVQVGLRSVPLSEYLVQGGYPQPLLELSTIGRKRWLANYVTTFLTRDLLELGIQTNTTEFERLIYMLAHLHGGLFNASELARSLRISAPTVQRYLDILSGAFLVRMLQPYYSNLGKRLTKSPRVYWRDSGLRHGLLGIPDYNALLLHPGLGASWEGYAIEEIIRAAGEFARPYFYRSADGAELDLVLTFGGDRRLAFECKFSTGPTLSKGNHNAIADVDPAYTYVVTPETGGFRMKERIEVVSLAEAISRVVDFASR